MSAQKKTRRICMSDDDGSEDLNVDVLCVPPSLSGLGSTSRCYLSRGKSRCVVLCVIHSSGTDDKELYAVLARTRDAQLECVHYRTAFTPLTGRVCGQPAASPSVAPQVRFFRP